VKVFSTIAAPLYALTKKEVKYEWTPDCQRAFETFRLRLIWSLFFLYILTKKTYILDYDASNFGLGAVLSQE